MLPHTGFWLRRRQTILLHDPVGLRVHSHGWVGVSLAAVLLLIAPSLVAQSLPSSPAIEFDDLGRDVAGYVLYATRKEDGVERRIELGRPRPAAGGRTRVQMPPLETGTWRLELAAYNDAGESPRTPASPPEIRVSAPARPAATTTDTTSQRQQPGASAAKPPKQQPPSETKDRKKGSVMGKLWRVIVGSDNP